MISPADMTGPDDRLTQEQYETFKQDMEQFPDKVGLLGFNEANWLCYTIDGQPVAVAPSGVAYLGRDAHLRRHEDES